jgi:hypothetical protein
MSSKAYLVQFALTYELLHVNCHDKYRRGVPGSDYRLGEMKITGLVRRQYGHKQR